MSAEQRILPGMQKDLGIRNVETIPADEVNRLSTTQRTYTDNDVVLFLQKMGIAEDEIVEIQEARKAGYNSLGDPASIYIIMNAALQPERGFDEKFQEMYSADLNFDNIFSLGYGGVVYEDIRGTFTDLNVVDFLRDMGYTDVQIEMIQKSKEYLGGFTFADIVVKEILDREKFDPNSGLAERFREKYGVDFTPYHIHEYGFGGHAYMQAQNKSDDENR